MTIRCCLTCDAPAVSATSTHWVDRMGQPSSPQLCERCNERFSGFFITKTKWWRAYDGSPMSDKMLVVAFVAYRLQLAARRVKEGKSIRRCQAYCVYRGGNSPQRCPFFGTERIGDRLLCKTHAYHTDFLLYTSSGPTEWERRVERFITDGERRT